MATLKISDLSIGDWVQNDYGDYVKVEGIWQGCNSNYQVDIFCDGKIATILPCHLHPIPITAEILEANGWRIIEKEVLGEDYEYNGGERVWDDENCTIEICEAKQGVFWYSWSNEYYMWRLEYVHQLQHLIRVAGVDKEINLYVKTMTIETKYNIGDEVWFMDKNKPIKGIVIKLDIDIARTGDWYIEHYKVEANGFQFCKVGQHLSPTKEELLKSL